MPADPNASAALELHRQILAELDKSDADNERREKDAHEVIDECAQTRKANAAKRHVLLEATRIYQEFSGALPGAPLPLDLPKRAPREVVAESPLNSSRPPRARIGPQRYRIFHVLRQQHPIPVSEENISLRTGLTTKRVRDQMRGDVPDGMVRVAASGEYVITDAGLALMARFEAYKQNKGQPLPSLVGPIGDDDGEDADQQLEPEERTAA
jgi:hypothetical protein